jgi:hypothetical protein
MVRPPGKQQPMDPGCDAYGREGEDIEAAWDGYAWWRMPPLPSPARMCATQR